MHGEPPDYRAWCSSWVSMLGGRRAQALAERLLLPVSKDTFLRSVRAASRCTPEQLRVIGIDDWAWRRGRRYGTLI